MSRSRHSLPRVVIVSRKSSLELLLERHGTLAQARFYLESRGGRLEDHQEAHERQIAGLREVEAAIPPDQRRTRVLRDQLDRFLFASDDVLVIVGQDGLVPNAAKYLSGQLTVGVNPDPARYDGVLCRHAAAATASFLDWVERPDERFAVEERTMAEARREDGQRLLALNEVFVGHRTHQSARYRLAVAAGEERQSSSGLLCATGTGATGWVRSVARQRRLDDLPSPGDRRLVWLVREPFPSVATGTDLDFGFLTEGETLRVDSEMGEGGLLFADGIESDWIELVAGQRVTIGLAAERLRLVVPGRGGP